MTLYEGIALDVVCTATCEAVCVCMCESEHACVHIHMCMYSFIHRVYFFAFDVFDASHIHTHCMCMYICVTIITHTQSVLSCLP